MQWTPQRRSLRDRAMNRTRPTSAQNRLLACLPQSTQRQVLQLCDLVELESGHALSTAGEPLRHVYFPTSGFSSLVAALDAGAQVDVGIVGSEGMVGVPLILGVKEALQTATVRCSGVAWRMSAEDFKQQLALRDALRR